MRAVFIFRGDGLYEKGVDESWSLLMALSFTAIGGSLVTFSLGGF